ncbi:MAG: ABC transporter substrate-binding protein [Streptosporangiaceae bacterium]
MLAAVNTLRSQGISVHLEYFSNNTESVQALVAGRCNIGFDSLGDVLTSNESGANFKVFGVETANEFSLVTRKSITSVSQLTGKRYGVYSETSYDHAMGVYAADQAKVKPTFIVAGSTTARAPEIVSGQLDATGLDVATIVALKQQSPGQFNILESFQQTIPHFLTNVIFASSSVLSADASTVSAFMTALKNQYDNIDVRALETIGKKSISGWDDTDNETVEAYVSQNMWPKTQSSLLSTSNADWTANFYKTAGQIKSVPDVSTYIDTTYTS